MAAGMNTSARIFMQGSYSGSYATSSGGLVMGPLGYNMIVRYCLLFLIVFFSFLFMLSDIFVVGCIYLTIEFGRVIFLMRCLVAGQCGSVRAALVQHSLRSCLPTVCLLFFSSFL